MPPYQTIKPRVLNTAQISLWIVSMPSPNLDDLSLCMALTSVFGQATCFSKNYIQQISTTTTLPRQRQNCPQKHFHWYLFFPTPPQKKLCKKECRTNLLSKKVVCFNTIFIFPTNQPTNKQTNKQTKNTFLFGPTGKIGFSPCFSRFFLLATSWRQPAPSLHGFRYVKTSWPPRTQNTWPPRG